MRWKFMRFDEDEDWDDDDEDWDDDDFEEDDDDWWFKSSQEVIV